MGIPFRQSPRTKALVVQLSGVLDVPNPPLRPPADATLLADGPLCGVAPGRFDGDLLRVRRVRVTIRAQAADRALRGTGAAFSSAGASTDGYSYVPDIEVTFDVAPRNLRSGR